VVLIGGEYLQYRNLIPPQFSTRVTVELAPFRKAVDRAALIAREGNNNLLVLKISAGEMAIESRSEIGDVFEKLDVQHVGSDMSIAFNVKYLTDVVRSIDAEQVTFSMNSPISPCIITPVGDPDYLHLVLPVRTGATA
jgi:DNA polymerase-3 subunit beta